MTITLNKNSKLKDYFKNYLNSKKKNKQSNMDWKDFFKKSFKTSRNEKTKELLKIFSYLLSKENNYISDNVLIVNSLKNKIHDLSKKSFLIADKVAFEFINKNYNLSINIDDICYIDEIKSGKNLKDIIKKINKGKYFHLLAIGGGKTLDFAKFISLKANIRLITIPSSLATHVYASPKIHALYPIKELGFQKTIDGDSSHLSLIDLKLLDQLYKKNKKLVLSGFGDLMAFINARHDWKQSSARGNERYSALVDQSIDFIISKLESIDIQKPLKEWIEDYIFIQCLLCNITHWVGSAPASGAEHLFAKCIEEELAIPPLHGEVVAIGVLIFSYIRNKEVNKVRLLLEKFNISNSFKSLNINKIAVINSLNNCLDEGMRKNRYTIINDLKLEPYFFENIINSMLDKKILKE